MTLCGVSKWAAGYHQSVVRLLCSLENTLPEAEWGPRLHFTHIQLGTSDQSEFTSEKLKLAHLPACSLLSSSLYLDRSHWPVLAPAILAALPSTRAIETRSLPISLAATHRGFAFYVAFPKSSIPSVARCSMSLIPFASLKLAPFPTRSLLPSQFYLLCR